MRREDLIAFAKKVREEHVAYFRLYNALYRVTFSRDQYTILQEGVDVSYSYSSLDELFNHYVVYGSYLINSLEDIKFV